jgi:hypothetical protein
MNTTILNKVISEAKTLQSKIQPPTLHHIEQEKRLDNYPDTPRRPPTPPSIPQQPCSEDPFHTFPQRAIGKNKEGSDGSIEEQKEGTRTMQMHDTIEHIQLEIEDTGGDVEEIAVDEERERRWRFAQVNEDMERIHMEQEDRMSRIVQDIHFQNKFKQKDVVVPLSHNILTTSVFFNTPVRPNLPVQEPMKDSFTKYMANFRPPDLSKVKFRVLWSKEKVAKEKEEKLIQKEKAKREKKNNYLKTLSQALEKPKSTQPYFKSTKSIFSSYISQPNKPIEYSMTPTLPYSAQIASISFNLSPSKSSILSSKIVENHSITAKKLSKFTPSI